MNETNPTADNADAAGVAIVTEAGPKERAVFVLRSLIELIENDRVRAEDIAGLTADDILDLAESEAQKAVDGSQGLIDGQ